MRRLVVFVTMAAALAGCASTLSVESTAPSEAVTVDAKLTEWAGKLNAIDNGKMSVGVQNDGEFLYVSLSTQNPTTVAQIMQLGLILWIDPTGGKNKTFGIRYPIGVTESDGSNQRLSDDMAANRVRIERSMQEVELIGAGGQSSRRRKDAVPGIEMHAEYDSNVLTYEGKIPLAPTEGVLYAIGTRPGQEVRVGLTTPEVKRTLAQQSGEGGLPGGNLSSADGRNRYGDRRMNPDSGVPSISHWITVTLADAP